MVGNIQLDLATLALKGKRYSEAEAIFTQIALQEQSPEPWIGIGICKLYQLANGRTMDEVIFCFEKAKEIDRSMTKEIESQLISNCQILLNAYLAYFSDALNKMKAQKKNAQVGALLAGVSMVAGVNSKSAFGFVASLAGSSAGIAVALDAFEEMKSIDEVKKYILFKCDEINNAIRLNTDNQSDAFIEYSEYVNGVLSIISDRIEIDNANEESKKKNGIGVLLGILGFIVAFYNSLFGILILILAGIFLYESYSIKKKSGIPPQS